LHLITLNDTHTHTRWDSSGRVIGPTQITVPDKTQLSQETVIHTLGGVRTRNPKKRAAADPCLDCAAAGISSYSFQGINYILFGSFEFYPFVYNCFVFRTVNISCSVSRRS